jgi:hypothetical protein
MSKLLPFTALIVTTGDDGCLLYHTVHINTEHPSTILFLDEVKELLTNPSTAEIAAVFPGHVKSLSSRLFNPHPQEETDYSADELGIHGQVDAWHITCPNKDNFLYTNPTIPELVHRGSVDFDYIFGEYDSYLDLSEAEEDIALRLVELSEYMEEHQMTSMGISYGFLQHILSHPTVNFDALEQTYEETTGPCFPDPDEEEQTPDEPTDYEQRSSVYMFTDAERERWEEEDQLATYQGEGWHGQ